MDVFFKSNNSFRATLQSLHVPPGNYRSTPWDTGTPVWESLVLLTYIEMRFLLVPVLQVSCQLSSVMMVAGSDVATHVDIFLNFCQISRCHNSWLLPEQSMICLMLCWISGRSEIWWPVCSLSSSTVWFPIFLPSEETLYTVVSLF